MKSDKGDFERQLRIFDDKIQNIQAAEDATKDPIFKNAYRNLRLLFKEERDNNAQTIGLE